MTNFKLHTTQYNKDYCSSYFAAYMNGEWGIEVGYKVLPIQIVTMNKELMDWQLDSDCCALCAVSTSGQTFSIASYAVLNPHPCYPLIPLYAGPSQAPCFVNQSLNYQNGTQPCCN